MAFRARMRGPSENGYIGYLERRNVRLVFTAINVDTFIDIKFLALTYGQYYCGDA